MRGPAPKAPAKRRRANTPASYGAASPTIAPAASPDVGRALGIDDPHPLVLSLWDAVNTSCESAFYSEADWERLRFELWYADTVMRGATVVTSGGTGLAPRRPPRARWGY